jgi:excisionase family DNA binding protein
VLLTTQEVAERLGVTVGRVHHFISEGRLPSAEKKGRDYLIDDKDLKLVKNRKPGRPKLKRTSAKKELTHERSK